MYSLSKLDAMLISRIVRRCIQKCGLYEAEDGERELGKGRGRHSDVLGGSPSCMCSKRLRVQLLMTIPGSILCEHAYHVSFEVMKTQAHPAVPMHDLRSVMLYPNPVCGSELLSIKVLPSPWSYCRVFVRRCHWCESGDKSDGTTTAFVSPWIDIVNEGATCSRRSS